MKSPTVLPPCSNASGIIALAKLVRADGTIEDYDRARRFDLMTAPVRCFDELLGVLRELTGRPDEVPAWSDQPEDLKPVLAREMEIYAAFLE